MRLRERRDERAADARPPAASRSTCARAARRSRGATIELSAREFALLELFLRHPDQVLSREQLLARVWGYDFDPGSNVVEVYVGYLRRKLGPDHIATVRGMGYRLRQSSSWVTRSDLAAAGVDLDLGLAIAGASKFTLHTSVPRSRSRSASVERAVRARGGGRAARSRG